MIQLLSLKPNPDNPRTITKERLKALVKSVKDFPAMMKLRPIIVDENDMVLGGNQRLKALLELGYTEVPNDWVKKAKDLTEDERRRFIVIDNEGFGETDWDTVNEHYDRDELIEWGVLVEDVPEKNEKPKTVELEPYRMTHVLLSFPPEKMIEIQHHLEAIVSYSFVEYEQSNN